MALKPFTSWLCVFIMIIHSQVLQVQPKGGLPHEKTTRIQSRLTEQASSQDGKVDEQTYRLRRQLVEKFFFYNIIYVIDSSSSITNVDFRLAIEAIELLTAKARSNTTYAAVLFANHAQVISEFTSPKEIVRRLKAAKRLRGATNNYAALKACSKLIRSPRSGLNPKALNRIVMITDGLFNMERVKSIKEAFQLKLNNTDIFVVAVGRYLYGAPEISSLASTVDSHVFRVKTMKGLVEVVKWNPYINPWEHLDKAPPKP